MLRLRASSLMAAAVVALVAAGCGGSSKPAPQTERIMDCLKKAGFEARLATFSYGGSGPSNTGGSAPSIPSILVGPTRTPAVELIILSPEEMNNLTAGHPEFLETQGEVVRGNVWIRVDPFGPDLGSTKTLTDVPRGDEIRTCAAS